MDVCWLVTDLSGREVALPFTEQVKDLALANGFDRECCESDAQYLNNSIIYGDDFDIAMKLTSVLHAHFERIAMVEKMAEFHGRS